MPAAIPVAVMAAGAIAKKVAEHKAAQKTAKAQNALNDNSINLGNKLQGYGDEDRQYQTGSRGKIDSAYWDLYNGIGGDGSGSGGGGGGFTPQYADARMNEAMPFYRNAMNTGLYSDSDKNSLRARAGINAGSTFAGLQRQLDQGANVRGGGFAGYSGQRALLSRDRARAIDEARLNNELGMQDQIRQNMFRGGEGVGKYDTEFMNNERMVEGLRNSAAASASARASAGADDDFRNKMAILSQLRGLRGESGSDLPYFQMASGNYRGLQAPQAAMPWYGAAGDVAQSAAGAYMGGGFGGLAGGARKVMGPTREELGAY